MNSGQHYFPRPSRPDSRDGRAWLSFASPAEVDEFIQTLERYERGELSPEQWRAFRLVRGLYGQRQDDVQMLRVKLPQGRLSQAALRTLADLCERYSRGFGHITTRQNVQLHFVKLSDVPACMERLLEAGVTTREACGNSVRNIVACPFAGVCPAEVFDVTPYAEATTRYLLRHDLSSTLPRKFKIAFAGCEDDCAGTAFNDIGFRARLGEGAAAGERGFQVTVGGGTATLCQSGWLLHAFIPAGRILEVAEAVLRVFHRHGNRQSKANARMKYLIRKLGWESWKKLYETELAALQSEGDKPLLPFGPQAPEVEQPPAWLRPAPPDEQQLAHQAALARVKGPGIVPQEVSAVVPVPASAAEFARFCATNVRGQRQPGFVAVTLRLPLGDVTGAQLRIVADLARVYGDGTVRTTPQQNLVMRWVRREDLAGLYRRLRAAGLAGAGAGTIADLTACPGAESCRLAVTQSRGLGRALSALFEARPDLAALAAEASIKISGCPNGCSQHHIATLGFQGSMRRFDNRAVIPQYQLLVGGAVGSEGARFGRRSVRLPARRVAAAVERLLEWYRDCRQPGQSAPDFFARADLGAIAALLADLCDISAADAKPQDYVDLGDDRVFTGETKEGECAA